MKKYELTDDTITILGIKLHRINALRDFGGVKKGDLGGYIQSENNLSHDGDSWVFGNAWVYGDARVAGSARVCGNAQVFGDAVVGGDAEVYVGTGEASEDEPLTGSLKNPKYNKQIGKETVDVYDVLKAWDVRNPALQHLIKKALQAGNRGHKDLGQDMDDIIASAIRAKELTVELNRSLI